MASPVRRIEMPKPMRVGDFRARMRGHMDNLPADLMTAIEQLLDINNRLVEAYLHENLPDTEESPPVAQVLVSPEIYEGNIGGALYAKPLVLMPAGAPASSADTAGQPGEVRVSNTHIYVKCPDGNWRRGALSTF